MTKDEAWEMIDSALDHSYSEKDVMEIKEALAQPAQEPVARITVLEAALNEIASAGMSPPPEMSDDGKTAWHASQAWRFIGIAARAIELAPAPVGERCCYHDSDCAVHKMPAYPAGPCDCSLASLAQPAQEPVAINWDAVHEKLCDVWRHDLSADEGLDEIQDLIATLPAAAKEENT